MAGKITDLTAIPAIDRTTDILEIVDVSADASYKVTANNLVGIASGEVLSTTDTQTVGNKLFDDSNLYNVFVGNIELRKDADPGTTAAFDMAAVAHNGHRTYSLPDATGMVVLEASTATLSNKTLDAPTITGGTIDNSTITVDSVAGHTSASIVTVAGLQISSGVIGSNGVATASIADGAVTPAKLTAGAGSGWSWSTWTPTWGNVTVGNGTVEAKYIEIGKTVVARISLNFGNTTAITGSVSFTLPITAVTYPNNVNALFPLGTLNILDNGTGTFTGDIRITSTTVALLDVFNAGSTYLTSTALSSTVPMTWTTGDAFNATIIYEAA